MAREVRVEISVDTRLMTLRLIRAELRGLRSQLRSLEERADDLERHLEEEEQEGAA